MRKWIGYYDDVISAKHIKRFLIILGIGLHPHILVTKGKMIIAKNELGWMRFGQEKKIDHIHFKRICLEVYEILWERT